MAKRTGTPAHEPEDPNALEGSDTGPLGDRSPRFRTLKPEEKLALIMAEPLASVAWVSDHALDSATPNAKIVVVTGVNGGARRAVLATSDGPVALPDGDPAHRLPVGTRVYKVEDGRFEIRLPQEYAEHNPGPYVRAAELIALVNRRIQGETD